MNAKNPAHPRRVASGSRGAWPHTAAIAIPTLDAYMDARSMRRNRQGRRSGVHAQMQAFEQAADDYTTLVEPHIASVEATTPRTIDELKQLLRAACTQVSHGSQSAAAR